MRPEIDEVAVGKDGVGFAKLFINKIHNER